MAKLKRSCAGSGSIHRRVWCLIAGSLPLFLVGCGSNPTVYPPGTEAHLVAARGDLVPVLVPTDQELWSKSRRTWLAAGTEVVVVADPNDSAGLPADFAPGPPSRVAVVSGPQAGVDVLVAQSSLGFGPRPQRDQERLNRVVLGFVLAATLVGLGWEACQAAITAVAARRTAQRGRTRAVASIGADWSRAPGLVWEQDDARWLAWLRVQNARRRQQPI